MSTLFYICRISPKSCKECSKMKSKAKAKNPINNRTLMITANIKNNHHTG